MRSGLFRNAAVMPAAQNSRAAALKSPRGERAPTPDARGAGDRRRLSPAPRCSCWQAPRGLGRRARWRRYPRVPRTAQGEVRRRRGANRGRASVSLRERWLRREQPALRRTFPFGVQQSPRFGRLCHLECEPGSEAVAPLAGLSPGAAVPVAEAGAMTWTEFLRGFRA